MKWIFISTQPCTDLPQFKCSKCGMKFLDCAMWNYCPNCGEEAEGISMTVTEFEVKELTE